MDLATFSDVFIGAILLGVIGALMALAVRFVKWRAKR